MKILVIGEGGREHAIAWKIAQSNQVDTVYVAPGNAGTATEPKVENVDIASSDIESLLDFAARYSIDLTIVGPEAPLVAGIVDRFEQQGLKIFGPAKAAAQLEGSKSFSKDFMKRHGIPTARYETFTLLEEAIDCVEQWGAPIVVKADGLAAGKGVIVAETVDEAKAAIKDMLAGNRFGSAGHRIVIEEYLPGEEASFIAICDGQSALPMASSQDHKRVGEGDTGPNTGGMGAYSPAPVVDKALHEQIMSTIIKPVLAGMKKDGTAYKGFLYAGLMISPDKVARVIEFNCRMGDPETQPLLMRLKSDLLSHMLAAVDERIADETAQWSDKVALGIVMASKGYPGSYDKGHDIVGLDRAAGHVDTKVFHAGTRKQDTVVKTSGGRVLCVTALGDDVSTAQERALSLAQEIKWPGVQYRKDIGYRAINRQS